MASPRDNPISSNMAPNFNVGSNAAQIQTSTTCSSPSTSPFGEYSSFDFLFGSEQTLQGLDFVDFLAADDIDVVESIEQPIPEPVKPNKWMKLKQLPWHKIFDHLAWTSVSNVLEVWPVLADAAMESVAVCRERGWEDEVVESVEGDVAIAEIDFTLDELLFGTSERDGSLERAIMSMDPVDFEAEFSPFEMEDPKTPTIPVEDSTAPSLEGRGKRKADERDGSPSREIVRPVQQSVMSPSTDESVANPSKKRRGSKASTPVRKSDRVDSCISASASRPWHSPAVYTPASVVVIPGQVEIQQPRPRFTQQQGKPDLYVQTHAQTPQTLMPNSTLPSAQGRHFSPQPASTQASTSMQNTISMREVVNDTSVTPTPVRFPLRVHLDQQHNLANMDPQHSGNVYRQQMNAAYVQQGEGMAAGQGMPIAPWGQVGNDGNERLSVTQQIRVAQRKKLEQEQLQRRYLTQMRMRGIPVPMPASLDNEVDMGVDVTLGMGMSMGQTPAQRMGPPAQMFPAHWGMQQAGGLANMNYSMPPPPPLPPQHYQQSSEGWQQGHPQAQQVPPPQQQQQLLAGWGTAGLSAVLNFAQPAQQSGWDGLEQSGW